MSEWKRLGTLGYTLFAVIAGAWAASARELSVDWKFYGGATFGRNDYNICFYDASGVVREPDSHIRVWTKCLPQKNIDSVDTKKDFDGRILEKTAEKVAHHYVPPIAGVEATDFDQSIAITGYEEIANIGSIEPHAKIFYELNCPERMSRELSMYFQIDRKSGSSNKPNDWTLPIRLMQTPATCRVRPRAGIKFGIGRRLSPARDAEQRAEGVERVEPSVEAERELIEVGL